MDLIEKLYNSDLLVRGFFALSTFLLLLTRISKTLFSYTLHGKRLTTSNRYNYSKFLVPKSLFSTFYVIGLISNGFMFYKEHREFFNIFRVLYITHIVRRLFEQVFLFTRLPKPSKMHILGCLFGLSFYVVTALAVNGPSNLAPTKFCVFLNMFAQGLQFYCHVRLSELRTDSSGSKVYKVPKGGPFNFVLCPHYLAEILIYVSLCCNLNMLLCLVFVTIELSSLAQTNKVWYFQNFPRSQLHTNKALVPFVF